jgi:hypothetical protein
MDLLGPHGHVVGLSHHQCGRRSTVPDVQVGPVSSGISSRAMSTDVERRPTARDSLVLPAPGELGSGRASLVRSSRLTPGSLWRRCEKRRPARPERHQEAPLGEPRILLRRRRPVLLPRDCNLVLLACLSRDLAQALLEAGMPLTARRREHLDTRACRPARVASDDLPYEEGDSMVTEQPATARSTSVADQLRELGVKASLCRWPSAASSLTVKCEMPQCYHHKGPRRVRSCHAAAHQVGALARPLPGPQVGRRKARPRERPLSHIWCNNLDYGRRTQIRTLLAKGKSLAEIAEALNSKGVPPAHGRNRWTAAMVREAYVS